MLAPTYSDTCKPEDFPVAYGHTYCERFSEQIDEFSAVGKDFVKQVNLCMKGKFMPHIKTPLEVKDCGEIETLGLKIQQDCFIKFGFCEQALNFDDEMEMLLFLKPFFKVYEVENFNQLLETRPEI